MATNPSVLVIDDDEDFRASVRSLLENHGYVVFEADSGADGLLKVVEHKPSLIVLDIMMKCSSEGYGVNQAIKHQEEYRNYRNIPVVMTSSIELSPDELFPMAGEVEMIRPDYYLTKPLDIPVFLQVVETGRVHLPLARSWRELIERNGRAGNNRCHRRRPRHPPVLQEDPVQNGLSGRSLRRRSAGLEGVARLKPGLAVVDLKMPGISGMEVIARVHEIDPRDRHRGHHRIRHHRHRRGGDEVRRLRLPAQAVFAGRAAADRQSRPGAPPPGDLSPAAREMERELLKRRFVTFVSHQLQTPLVAIHQYLNVLRHLDEPEDAAAKTQEWLDRCLARTEEMQTIIKDWLTLAKTGRRHALPAAGQGRSEADRHRDPGDLRGDGRPPTGFRWKPGCPKTGYFVTGDRNCLSVLFDNLIVNAIKYNKPGGKVTVSAELTTGEVDRFGERHRDRHPGEVPPDAFRGVLSHRGRRTRRPPAPGLGLAISKRVVSEMGGSISVESAGQMSVPRSGCGCWPGGSQQAE